MTLTPNQVLVFLYVLNVLFTSLNQKLKQNWSKGTIPLEVDWSAFYREIVGNLNLRIKHIDQEVVSVEPWRS